jgi:hypothetical protein
LRYRLLRFGICTAQRDGYRYRNLAHGFQFAAQHAILNLSEAMTSAEALAMAQAALSELTSLILSL